MLVRLEANDRIVGVERLVLIGQLLELPEEITNGHAFIVGPGPGDHSFETTAFFQPLMSDVYQRLVVRHESTAERGRFLEVLRIQSIFREGIDASNHVPAGSSESFDEISEDVVVRVEREATSHANARSTIGVCSETRPYPARTSRPRPRLRRNRHRSLLGGRSNK